MVSTHMSKISKMSFPFGFWQQDLDLALSNSAANWKIVIGHHAIRIVGHHGDTRELVNQLPPVLEVSSHCIWQ